MSLWGITIYLNKDPTNYGVNWVHETNHFADPLGFGWGKCGVVFGLACGSSTGFHLITRIIRWFHLVPVWSNNLTANSTQSSIWWTSTICPHWSDLLSSLWRFNLGVGRIGTNYDRGVIANEDSASARRSQPLDHDSCACWVYGYLDSCSAGRHRIGCHHICLVTTWYRHRKVPCQMESRVSARTPLGSLGINVSLIDQWSNSLRWNWIRIKTGCIWYRSKR